MKTLTKAVSVISLLALALASTMVSAQDMKTYPGSTCKAYYGSDASKANFYGGTITTNAGMSIECPILRGEPVSTRSIGVSIWGTKGTGTLSCSVRNTSVGGGSTQYVSMGQASASGLYYLGATVGAPAFYGNLSFYCSAPSGVSIKQIHVTEILN